MKEKIDGYFKNFIKNLDVDEYDKCSAEASKCLTDFSKIDESLIADTYRPYANYFRIFADAYRLWQVSYVYTDIRNRFNLASHLLNRDINLLIERRITGEEKNLHENLLLAFDGLSKMLCFYTRCENSFVSNDPFSLEKFSAKAIEIETATLQSLNREKGWVKAEKNYPILFRIYEWLVDYFTTNQKLHIGLNECANSYWNTFRRLAGHGHKLSMEKAREACTALKASSEELASELNAHIEHISRHFKELRKVEEELGEIELRPEEGKSGYAERDEKGQKKGFLRVTEGKLVLGLSATCSDDWVRTEIYGHDDTPTMDSEDFEPKKELIEKFERKLTEKFDEKFKHTFSKDFAQKRIPTLINFRTLKRHDIFETTFGKYYLQTLAFNLPDVELTVLDDRKFIFNTSINLSTLGVCTVYFKLDVDKVKGGLSVEEIRLLQSCICPHAGEVRLDFVEPENSRKHEANKKADCLIRLEEELKIIGDLLEERRRICSEARQEIRREIVEKPQEKVDFEWIAKKLHEFNELLEIEDYIDYAIFITDFDRLKAFTTQPKAQQTSKGYFVDSTDFDFDERLAYVAESLKYLSELKLVDRDGWLSLKANIKNLNSIQNTYRYLFKIAEIFLEIVRDVFEDMNPAILELQSSESGINKNWQLSPDTGWYSYLFATCINQVGLAKDVVLQHRASFNRIDNHPDTIGFRIEQREARASFDDWRFMNTKGVEGEENLAHIRSHDSDAFFGSEYQSFLYFPSDPQFLMDQYEETVRLMMRLSVMLKGYNSLAYDMIRKVRNYLSMVNHKKGRVSPDTSRLGTFLQEIGDLRLGASETISLTANAGISRYKDHGILMTKITEKMKLNSVIKSINDQLDSLDFITRNILASLEAKRERTLTRTGLLLTLLFTAITVDTLVKALFSFRIDFISFRVNAVLELLQRITEGAWTILLWSFVSVAIVIWYRLKNK